MTLTPDPRAGLSMPLCAGEVKRELPSLFSFVFRLSVSRAGQHRQTRVLWKSRVDFRVLTAIENLIPRGTHAAGMQTVGAQSDVASSWILGFDRHSR
jgi:hypothetical protein